MALARFSRRAGRYLPCPSRVAESSRWRAIPACAIGKRASCRTANTSWRSRRQAAKPNSGSTPQMASARRNNGREIQRCCAGTASPRRTANGWRIGTRISSFGFTTPARSRTSALRNPDSATSTISSGLPTAAGSPSRKRLRISFCRSACSTWVQGPCNPSPRTATTA